MSANKLSSVHLGNEDKGFEHKTLRSVMAIIWTFEDQLEQIHSQRRRENKYAFGLWKRSFLGVDQSKETTSRKAGLENILRCNTVNQVCDLMGDYQGERTAYDIKLLRIPYKFPSQRTIEFRGAASTLDTEWIQHWIQVCHGLVRFAFDSDPSDVEDFCRRRVDRAQATLEEVLMDLGLPLQADYFSSKTVEDLTGIEDQDHLINPDWMAASHQCRPS